MPTTVRSLCAYFFSFSLGLASALPLSLLLRRVLQGRAASPRQSAMSWLPSGQYDEQTLASAKHAMSYVRPKLRRPLMEPVWDAGFDLLAGLDGVGVQSTLSCTSSIGSQEGTRRSRTTRAQGRQVYSAHANALVRQIRPMRPQEEPRLRSPTLQRVWMVSVGALAT